MNEINFTLDQINHFNFDKIQGAYKKDKSLKYQPNALVNVYNVMGLLVPEKQNIFDSISL